MDLPSMHSDIIEQAHATIDELHYHATRGSSNNVAFVLGVADQTPPQQQQPPPLPAGDKFDQLIKMMADAGKPAKEQTANNKVPTTAVSFKPSVDPNSRAGMDDSWAANQEMLSLAELYFNIMDIANRNKRGHPEPYKLTDDNEAIIAFADQANIAFNAMNSCLSGFYVFTSGEMSSYSQVIDRDSFHGGLLNVLLDGISLNKEAKDNCEKVLNNFVEAVGKFNVEEHSEQKTVNYTTKVNTVPSRNISEEDNDVEKRYVPTTTLIYMFVEAKAWRVAVNKWGNEAVKEKVEFKMQFKRVKCELNMAWYNQTRDKFNQIMTFVTGKNLMEFGADLHTTIKQ